MDPIVSLAYGQIVSGKNRLTALIQDLTPEQLAERPAGFKNSIASLIVHVCANEINWAHRLLGQPVPDELARDFPRGKPGEPILQPSGETAESLTAKIDRARALLEATFRQIKDADLAREWPLGPERTVTSRYGIMGMPTHLSQHFGQMQMIKQHLGS